MATLPTDIQQLENPPDGVIVCEYKNLGGLSRRAMALSDKLRRHKTEDQLIFVTDFPADYIDDDVKYDRFRRAVWKSTACTYFWEHKLLILKLRPCNSYELVKCALDSQLSRYLCDIYPDAPDRYLLLGHWPDGYIGGHSARRSQLALTLDDGPGGGNKATNWPTFALETRSLSSASARYMDHAVDWWFHQSQGRTRIFMILSIDCNPAHRSITLEKWVSEKEPLPRERCLTRSLVGSEGIAQASAFQETASLRIMKRCEQKIVITPNKIIGAPLVLEFERLFDRPKKADHEKDFVLEEEQLRKMERHFDFL